MMGDGFGMGWGILMMVVMLVLVALVIAGVVWLVLRLVGDRDRSGIPDAARGGALEILERRFVAGEIDVDEYRERRSTLERGG
ncbi:MAG: SHOCT domain-containing protein [Solirubrobacterales bacterium]